MTKIETYLNKRIDVHNERIEVYKKTINALPKGDIIIDTLNNEWLIASYCIKELKRVLRWVRGKNK